MKKNNTHWTSDPKAFLFAISTDFALGIKERSDSQKKLAETLKLSEGRISQILNNPGNLTLKTMVNFAHALKMKVSVVLYDDKDDPENELGPIHADIFRLCWEERQRPRDFWIFRNTATTTQDLGLEPGVIKNYTPTSELVIQSGEIGKTASNDY